MLKYTTDLTIKAVLEDDLQREFIREQQEVSICGIICWKDFGTVELMWAMLDNTEKVKHTKIWK